MDPLDFAKLKDMEERDLLILVITEMHEMKLRCPTHADRLDKQHTRIRSLENWRIYITGATGALALIGYAAWDWLKIKVLKP